MSLRQITRMSIMSGKTRTISLKIPDDEWANYLEGNMLIQDALPSLSDADREFVKTGITNEEWQTLAAEEDEADAGQPDRSDGR